MCRDRILNRLNIARVPTITHGRFTLDELKQFLTQSKLSDQPAEGLYLRVDQGEWIKQRAKLVRPEFVQSMEHH